MCENTTLLPQFALSMPFHPAVTMVLLSEALLMRNEKSVRSATINGGSEKWLYGWPLVLPN